MFKENKEVLKEFNATHWHEQGYSGKGVTVVLLDGEGSALSHMKDYYTDVRGTQEGHGHATNVAMVLHEFAPDAEILMFDYKRKKDEVYEWVKANKDDIDLINVSLAGIAGSTTPDYVRFKDLGIPLVCASGNDSFEDRISFPARYDWTIAIGSFVWRHTGAFSRNVDGDSNWGRMLDAVAPTGIYVKNEAGQIYTVYGTSYAAPSATGMLACYVQWRKKHNLPKLQVEEARAFIHQNCEDIREEGFDYASGHGVFKLPKLSTLTPPKPKPNPPKEDTPVNEVNFKDIKGHWAESAIKDMAQKGIVSGRSKDQFDPNGTLTRAEMAVIASRILDRLGK